jgi:hypothetical protein
MRKKALVLGIILVLAGSWGYSQTLALKLGGGGGYASGGDIAKGLRGQSDYLKDAFGSSSVYGFPSLGWTAGGELLVYFGGHFAFGLGAAFESHSKESTTSYSVASIDIQEHVKPAFQVVPILGTLHFYLPLGASLKLDLNAGGGAYLTRLSWDSSDAISILGLSGADSYSFAASKVGFGAHAGIGLELALSAKLALVLNVTGRYARVSGFLGDWTETGTGDFWSFAESGSDHRIYYYDWTTGSKTYPQAVFQPDPPSGASIANVREARLDLSGVTATFGVKIALF